LNVVTAWAEKNCPSYRTLFVVTVFFATEGTESAEIKTQRRAKAKREKQQKSALLAAWHRVVQGNN
jgi:hypothetical protein